MGVGMESALREATTGCTFAVPPFAQIWRTEEEAVKTFLGAVCGWDITVADLNDIALRNFYFNRCVSLREGYHPSKDDYLPPRAFDEPIADKYGTTWVWDHAEFETAKKNYYVDTLKLTQGGLPPREELERLGLDFVISVLEPMNAVG